MSSETMTSSKPYLIRALYDWIVDNNLTPYLMVHASGEGVSVPQQYVNKEGQIVLNIAPRAVMDMLMGNEAIEFKARFGGVPTEIYVPCFSVLGIYARENGKGMMFDPETPPSKPPTPPSSQPDTSGGGGSSPARPSLRVVK